MLRGYGGAHLLSSYEGEMKPIIVRRLQISQSHVLQSMAAMQLVTANPHLMDADTQEGNNYRKKVAERLDSQGSMHADHGVELDSRYKSAIIFQDLGDAGEPKFDPKFYTPSTWPGARAPHVFLRDSSTSTLDIYGGDFTLFDFAASTNESSAVGEVFVIAAKQLNIPLKVAKLREEEHVHKIWERNLVLVRPDGHVAWRSSNDGDDLPDEDHAKEILKVIFGHLVSPNYVAVPPADSGFEDTATAMGMTEKVEDENRDLFRI